MLISYVHLSGVMYLAWCNITLNPTVCEQLILWKFRKSATETLAMVRQDFGGGGEAGAVHGKCKLTETEWQRNNLSGRLNNKFRIPLWRFTPTAWKYVKNSPRTLATKGCCIMTTQCYISFFTREFLTKNNMTGVPHPHFFSLFPRLTIKLNGRHFWHNWGDWSRILGSVNTLTEQDFQDEFKKWQKR
jgi:hypothetical protein